MGESDQAGAAPPEAPPKRRRRGRLRRLIKWSAVAVVLLVVVVLVLALCLPAITDTGLVKGKVTASISSALNGAEVHLDTLRLGVLGGGQLRMEGLIVAPPGRPDEPFIMLGSLECRVRLSELLDGRAHVTRLTADSVRVVLSSKDGRWNFEDILPPADEPAVPLRLEDLRLPLSVQVDGVRVSDVTIAVTMEDDAVAIIEGLTLGVTCELSETLEGEAVVTVTATGLQAGSDAGGLALPDGFEARLGLARKGMTAELSATFAAGAVRAGARDLGEFGPLPVEAGCSAQIDLARLAAPRIGLVLSMPPLLSDEASLTLTRDEGWHLSGRNDLKLDLAHLHRLVAHLQPQIVRSLDAAGQLEAGTDFAVQLGTDPMAFTAKVHTEAVVSELSVAAEVSLPDEGLADAALTDARVVLTQDLTATGPDDLRVKGEGKLAVTVRSLRGAMDGLADVRVERHGVRILR